MQRPLSVGQALHGYENGHRLLACSMKLDRDSESTMRELSDLASAQPSDSLDGYMSGYPLRTARAYVIAATWAAREVSRPGAAWTHSLLLSYDDIPKIGSAASLAALFRRPGPDVDRSSYGHTLQWIEAPDDDRPESLKWVPAEAVLKALYLTDRPVVVHLDAEGMTGSQGGVLAIWSQQWPSLRRSFRFRTSGRSSAGTAFDLTLVATKRAGASEVPSWASHRFGEGAELEWLHFLHSDLSRRSAAFHCFLSRYGLDAAKPRTALPLLVNCWLWLGQRSDNRAWLEDLASRESDDLAKLRGDIVSFSLAGQVGSPERLAELLWAAAELWPDAPAPQLGSKLQIGKMTQASQLLEILFERAADHGEGTLARYALGVAARNCDAAIVLDAIGDKLSRLEAVAGAVPALLTEQETWFRPAVANWLIRNGTVFPEDEARVIDFALSSTADVANAVIGRFGSTAIERWLAIAGTAGRLTPAADDQWLRAGLRMQEAFLNALASSPALSTALLDRISREYTRAFPGPPSRCDAWSAASANMDADAVAGCPNLRALLFSCALHAPSPQAEKLFEKTFESMHDELASEVLPILTVRFFSQFPWGSEWDRCLGLRISLAQAFVRSSLDPSALKRIIASKDTLSRVLSAIADQPGGKKYLRNALGNSVESHS